MAKKGKEMIVVGTKMKAYIKGKGMKSAGDTLEALNDKVHCILDAAVNRTKANKRSTVRPQDL